MKRRILTAAFVFFFGPGLLLIPIGGPPAGRFDESFKDRTMRVDYFHVGDAKEELITLDRVYDQGIWAGSKRHLLDEFNTGRYAIKVFDVASGALLFSRGFDSYFGEYQTAEPALKGVKKTFHESALIPYPRKRITFTVEKRNRENVLKPIFSQEIDPESLTVIREPLGSGVKVFELLRSGDPHEKVDVAFIAEGYTAAEEKKLFGDMDRFLKVFFRLEPYKSNRDKFNFYGVFKPSDESGCDEPSHGVFKNTAVGSSFDALGSERYLLTEDNKSLRDIAAHAPYDALFIMINHKRYGGGGIYHFYCTFTVDNQWYEYLFLHEFGHSFAGLGDEYYTSDVAYNEFYPPGVEPTDANLTALADPKNLKWKQWVTPGTAVPTPWEKEGFEKMDNANQKIRAEANRAIARMKREGAPRDEVAKAEDEAERLSKEHARQIDAYLRLSQFWGKTGAFEGAGYSAKGLYRPSVDCLMFSKGSKPFCKVCEEAVRRVIKFYSE